MSDKKVLKFQNERLKIIDRELCCRNRGLKAPTGVLERAVFATMHGYTLCRW